MKLLEKQITLKDGRTAILKTPELSDAAELLDFIKTACGETDFLLRTADEWSGVTVEGEEKWINGMRRSPDALALACYVEGKIVGNCEIRFMTASKTRHRAVIAISILKAYWSLGIGSAMFRELIATAEAHEGTEIVELEYMEGNERGRALYEKFGFTHVATRPCAFRTPDGKTHSEIFMQKKIGQ